MTLATGTQIQVTDHAAMQLKQRMQLPHTLSAVRRSIGEQVIVAWLRGRRSNHKPKWARLYGESGHPLRDREWFVWDEGATVGWIVKEEDDKLVVVTSMGRHDVRRHF